MADDGTGQLPPENSDHGNSTPNGQPTGDFVSVPRGDWEQAQTWKRHSEQAAGMRPIFEAAKNAGFSDPKDFESLGEYKDSLGTLNERGVGNDVLEQLLGGGAPKHDDSTFTRADFEKMLTDRLGEMETKQQTGLAEANHQRLVDEEAKIFGSLKDELATELLGEDANAFQKHILDNALTQLAAESRELYPQGHPLRDRLLRPMTSDEASAFKKSILDKRSSLLGEALAETGDAATKQAAKGPKPTAGKSGGQGKPDDDTPKRHPLDMPMADKIAALQARRAKRGGASSG